MEHIELEYCWVPHDLFHFGHHYSDKERTIHPGKAVGLVVTGVSPQPNMFLTTRVPLTHLYRTWRVPVKFLGRHPTKALRHILEQSVHGWNEREGCLVFTTYEV